MRKVSVAVSVVFAGALLLALTGCGTDPAFIPDAGAFLGGFRDGTAADIGDLSFTAHQTGIAGTGILHNGALDVDVAIAGNVSNGVITGQVTNSFLGGGTFRGKFNNARTAGGTFTFELVTGTELTGTWSATVN